MQVPKEDKWKKYQYLRSFQLINYLSNTRESFVIVFGSYANFNRIIKALIGAKFNTKFRFNDAFYHCIKIHYD